MTSTRSSSSEDDVDGVQLQACPRVRVRVETDEYDIPRALPYIAARVPQSILAVVDSNYVPISIAVGKPYRNSSHVEGTVNATVQLTLIVSFGKETSTVTRGPN